MGWRGYLLRQFKGKSFLGTAVIIGIIWGLWHAPLILMGHNYPRHPQWGVLMMVVVCILMSFIIQYFRIKSGSVIVAAIMHGTCNAVAGTTMVVAMVIFLFDRYVTRDRICTSPLTLDTIKKEQLR